ncbi:MAG: DUF3105 domain-containing protein [Chloroflexi bacterium]|nr:DUF3105 domain-containing protein [Chloroflexota bacterium]
MPDRVATTRPETRRGMTRGAVRAERRAKSDARKRRRRYIYTAIAGSIALLFIGSLLVPGGSGHGSSSNASLNTGGPVEILPDEGRGHVTPGTPGGPYQTQPAASGSHWIGDAIEIPPTGSPARWGRYDVPLGDEVQIHNLEHGGIILNYNCSEGCAELVDQLATLIPSHGAQFILAPYPNMDTRIAVTSWRHILQLDEFDADRINEFIDAYLDRAPESVPGNLF